MAIFYLDYEGGNDANDGTTFANRWKTFTSGATAARIAPGDTIRVMGSPAPTSLGINATWTNKSTTVTLASALNALITDCETAWTASANVTATTDTSTYRTGTKSVKLAIAAGFTTGLVAYFATGTLDLSAYQGITFWVRMDQAIQAGTVYSIKLCSDTAGVTAVDTFALPAWDTNSFTFESYWMPVYINKGSALGSSIKSIALYANSDPGTVNIFLDNISTVQAAGDNALSLQSLISKNTAGEYFWGIREINGTTLHLDSSPAQIGTVAIRGYYGATETVLTYKRETIKTVMVASASTQVASVQDSGSAGNLIAFSGGWNRTDMTTQTLETYFDGQCGMGVGLHTNSATFLNISNFCFVRYTTGCLIYGNDTTIGTLTAGNCAGTGISLQGSSLTITALHSYANRGAAFSNVNGSFWVIGTMRGVSCGDNTASYMGWAISSSVGTGQWRITLLELLNGGYHGLYFSGDCPASVQITTLSVHDNTQTGWWCGPLSDWRVGTLNANSNGGSGFNSSQMIGELTIGVVNAASNAGYGLYLSSSLAGQNLLIYSLITSGNASGAVATGLMSGRVTILKSSMAETSKLVLSSSGVANGSLSMQNYNGTAGDHRTYSIGGGSGTGLGLIFSESSVRHTASGLAWKLSPQSTVYINSAFPLSLHLARIAVNASALVTVKVWLRRTNTGLTGTLLCRGGQIAGVSADVTASITAAIDTWEEQTITFTPSEAGVVNIDVTCYGGTTYSLYVDDMTISQA